MHMYVRNLFIIILCSFIYSTPTLSMLTSATKKVSQMQRYKCYSYNGLGKAPYPIERFLKQMPKKFNFTDVQSTPVEIETLSAENKDLMLAHILCFMGNKYDEKDLKCVNKPEMLLRSMQAIAQLIKAGANPNTVMLYFSEDPVLLYGYEINMYPLRIALQVEDINFVEFLLNHGADVHGPEEIDYFPKTPEQEPIFFAEKIEYAKRLFDHGFKLDVEEKKERYERLVNYHMSIECIKLYLKHGAPICSTILHSLADNYCKPELLTKTELFIEGAPHIVNAIESRKILNKIVYSTPLDIAWEVLGDLFQDENIEDIERVSEYRALLEKNGAKTAAELKNLE